MVTTPQRAERVWLAEPIRRKLPWTLVVVGLSLLVLGCTVGLSSWTAGRSLPAAGIVPPAAPVSTVPATPAVPATPTRLILPGIGVDAPIEPVGLLPTGGLAVPDNPRVLGWWQSGAHPDSATGTVVIDGHVDTAGGGAGALFFLSRLSPGQQIVLDTDRGSRHYIVSALRSYAKADLPGEVFATTGRARLTLITCGGAFDRHTHQYTDNIVVYAVPQ